MSARELLAVGRLQVLASDVGGGLVLTLGPGTGKLLQPEDVARLRDTLALWLGDDDAPPEPDCPLCPHSLDAHLYGGCAVIVGRGPHRCACPRTRAELEARR